MAVFHMQIAGAVARVTSLFESTPAYFAAYLTDQPADFTIAVTQEDLRFEDAQLLAEAHAEGFRVRKFTDPFLERAAIQRGFAEFLFDQQVLLLHGSTLALDDQAFLFTAPSGTGKSTHTRLWREQFPDRVRMVNDDKPFLICREREVLACGSPWSGKHGLDSNITVPLRGICVLARGPENRIRPMAPEEALPLLLHQSYCPLDPQKADAHRQLVETLASQIPLWKMECTKDPEAAHVARNAMFQI